MKVYRNTQIYILCFANSQTGGPEALHQMRYYLDKCGYRAKMAYINAEGNDPLAWTPKRYHKYLHTGKDKENSYSSITIEQIEDSERNIVLGFESFSRTLAQFKKAQVAIWWLSVRFYDGDSFLPDYLWTFKLRGQISGMIRNVIAGIKKRRDAYPFKTVPNFVGSKYAYLYLKKRGLEATYMVEPISLEFLTEGMYDRVEGREDIILYNPAKRSKIMQQLLERGKFNYVPMKGYTPEQLVELMRRSKLYLDFGNFPGPERMPKETVWNGCNILVGKRNAASNDFDVAIPDKYKITNYSPKYVERKIQDMLEHFKEQHKDFDAFRKKIDGLEAGFIRSIQENFVREDRDYV